MAWSDHEREPLTPEFKRNRPKVLERDGHRCQLKWSRCIGKATEVDHKKNRASGGDDSMENLWGVCSVCHGMKTAMESRKAREKKKQDARHPWTRLQHPGLR